MSTEQSSDFRLLTRRRLLLGLVGVGAVAAAGYTVGSQAGGVARAGGATPSDKAAGETPAATDLVSRGDLVLTETVSGKVSRGTSWAASIDSRGIVTEVAAEGTRVASGEVLIWIDAKPVYLVTGAIPMYRELRYEVNEKARVKGDDVMQLQQFLVAGGYLKQDAADGEFGTTTRAAVKAWQKAVGLTVTGTVDRSVIVFHPGRLTIVTAPHLGAPFDQLTVSDGDQVVTARFAKKWLQLIPEGGDVTVAAPDGRSTSARISKVVLSVSASGTSELEMTATLAEEFPDAVDDVKVTGSHTAASGVLIVPVRAFVALSGGGYALEVVRDGRSSLKAAEIGVVVDERAELKGDFVDGDRVVVPSEIGVGS